MLPCRVCLVCKKFHKFKRTVRRKHYTNKYRPIGKYFIGLTAKQSVGAFDYWPIFIGDLLYCIYALTYATELSVWRKGEITLH